MIPLSINDILNGLLCFVFLFISVRALYLYLCARNPRLFSLSLSTGIIALTAAADFASGVVTTIPLSTNWFLYLGQAVSFLFILLSVLYRQEAALQRLIRWHFLVSIILLVPLILSPVLPDVPAPMGKILLSTARGLVCFAIFYRYVAVFMRKETRFSFLMALSFLLLSFGYLVLTPKFILPNQDLLNNTGDIMRIVGVATIFASFTVA